MMAEGERALKMEESAISQRTQVASRKARVLPGASRSNAVLKPLNSLTLILNS